MSTQDNKNSIKKFISLAGVAGASVFLSVPALAQTNPNYNTRANSNVRSTELLAQAISDYQESPSNCGGYQGNGTTGGGYYCALNRMNEPSSNGQASTMDRQSPTSSSDRMYQPSTTGAGYPGNGVAPKSGTSTMLLCSFENENATNELFFFFCFCFFFYVVSVFLLYLLL